MHKGRFIAGMVIGAVLGLLLGVVSAPDSDQ